VQRLIFLFASFALLAHPISAGGGATPALDWHLEGKVDWSAGFAVSYGAADGTGKTGDPNLMRRESRNSAYLAASRNLLRLCLDLRVHDTLTIRDYFRDDPELQKAFRSRLRQVPPWHIELGAGSGVRLAVKVPLGGSGGIAGILDEVGGFRSGTTAHAPEARSGSDVEGGITGLVLIASRRDLVPALRPRIRAGDGMVMLDYENSTEEARGRPAFIPYYGSVEEALGDPVVGNNPMSAAAGPYPGSDTDLLLPPAVQESLYLSPAGVDILRSARIAVVLGE